MIDPMTMVGGGAALAGVYAAWDYIKVYLAKIYSLFVVRIVLENDTFYHALSVWTLTKTKASKLTVRNFTGFTDFVKPISKNQYIAYEILSSEPTIYWYKRRPLIISGKHISFIRGTFNVNELIKDILDNYNSTQGDSQSNKENRFFIRKYHGTLQQQKNGNQGAWGKTEGSSPTESPASLTSNDNGFVRAIQNSISPIGWSKDDIGQIKKPEPMSHLALSDECVKAIEEIKRWRNSEQWYKDRQIPHKKGILLYGKPGCGKSSVAKALAMDLNMPIMIFDLSNMSNTDFTENWDRVKNNAPCMVLLEDIDSIFDGRKNVVHADGGLSFDCLLNSIDGVEASDGLLIVATTNNIDKIDIALGKPNGDGISTRPGRIDRALELVSPDEKGRKKIASRILCDFPKEIPQVVEDGNHDTGAQFQERCSRLALKLFWENKDAAIGVKS